MDDMDALLVDQQISGLLDKHPEWFAGETEDRRRSKAFVLMCVARTNEMSYEEAFDSITDGADDASVDAFVMGDVDDNGFTVTLYQGKYKKDLSGNANFPANALGQIAGTAEVLFDPSKKIAMNPRLLSKVEEARSLVREGYIPRVRIFLCNNGMEWDEAAQKNVENSKKRFGSSIEFKHFNHHDLISLLRRPNSIDRVRLPLSGKLIVEDQVFKRVLIGRIHVKEIVALYRQYGDQLLQRNIRKYLGLRGNRVNEDIEQTLNSDHADQFYFYNNGITIICSHFDYNAFQQADHIVSVDGLQVINGGQTCRTIFETFKNTSEGNIPDAYLLVRAYQVNEEDEDFVRLVTYATNSQNPVEMSDLHSNDIYQKRLEEGFHILGYTYRRQRDASVVTGPLVITSNMVAVAVLSIWRRKPQQGRFFRSEHFGKLYERIFKGLNAPQALLAVKIYRDVEVRRRTAGVGAPNFVPYASHYLAMLVGEELLDDLGLSIEKVDHRNFGELDAKFNENKDAYYQKALDRLGDALTRLYGEKTSTLSLQRLSATFRRGDLFETLDSE